MTTLDYAHVLEHRAHTFRLSRELKLRTVQDAIAYVNERGFLYFWPIKEVAYPSLWTAVAGDRPVADAHDDPGHVTWGWKDQMLPNRVWYYAKVLRKKSTFISLATLPYFYALSENYGDPDADYLDQYREGRLSHEAKTIYEVLLHAGPLDSPALRQAARMTTRESDAGFNRAMGQLQADFKLLPVGVAEVGKWKYAFIYDLTHRRFPDLLERARPISTNAARLHLAGLFLGSVGAAPVADIGKLFGWTPADAARAVAGLVGSGTAADELTVAEQRGKWVGLRELVG